MREILFRGKRKDTGELVSSGNLITFNDEGEGKQFFIPQMNAKCTCTHDEQDNIISFDSGMFYKVDPDTVGQFTGLTDKNGKRIFEGDIGRYIQTDGAKRNGNPVICIGKVVYNAKTASFAVESKDESGCKYFDYFPIKDFVVIGNIHDNPELLEGDRDG